LATIWPLNDGLIGKEQEPLFPLQTCIIIGGSTVIPAKAGIRDSPIVEVLPLGGCLFSQA
jgi:hypothetical protein